jgi:hypothetical protein
MPIPHSSPPQEQRSPSISNDLQSQGSVPSLQRADVNNSNFNRQQSYEEFEKNQMDYVKAREAEVTMGEDAAERKREKRNSRDIVQQRFVPGQFDDEDEEYEEEERMLQTSPARNKRREADASLGRYVTQRRASPSRKTPSTPDGRKELRPEIVVEFGSNKNRGKKYSKAVSTKAYKRFTDGAWVEVEDSADSDASNTLRTELLEDTPPQRNDRAGKLEVNSHQAGVHSQRYSSGPEVPTARPIPSPHVNSDQDDASDGYGSTRADKGSDTDVTRKARRLRRALEIHIPRTTSDVDTEPGTQVRFELGRAESRAKQRAEHRLAQKEKERAELREQARGRRGKEREEDGLQTVRTDSNPATTGTRLSPHRSSLTEADREEQQRLLAAELAHMIDAQRAAEIRDREEGSALLPQHEQDLLYYTPRTGRSASRRTSDLRRQPPIPQRDPPREYLRRKISASISQPNSPYIHTLDSKDQRASITHSKPPDIHAQVSEGTYSRPPSSPSWRTRRPPPVSFPANSNTRPYSNRRPQSSSQDNPFAVPSSVGSPSITTDQGPLDVYGEHDFTSRPRLRTKDKLQRHANELIEAAMLDTKDAVNSRDGPQAIDPVVHSERDTAGPNDSNPKSVGTNTLLRATESAALSNDSRSARDPELQTDDNRAQRYRSWSFDGESPSDHTLLSVLKKRQRIAGEDTTKQQDVGVTSSGPEEQSQEEVPLPGAGDLSTLETDVDVANAEGMGKSKLL